MILAVGHRLGTYLDDPSSSSRSQGGVRPSKGRLCLSLSCCSSKRTCEPYTRLHSSVQPPERDKQASKQAKAIIDLSFSFNPAHYRRVYLSKSLSAVL